MVVDRLLVDDRGCFDFGIFIQGQLSGLKETQVVPLSGQNVPKQKVDVLCTHYVVLIVVMLSLHKRLGYPLVLLVLVNVTVIEVLILNLTLLRLPLFFVLPHLDIFKHRDVVVFMLAQEAFEADRLHARPLLAVRFDSLCRVHAALLVGIGYRSTSLAFPLS